MRADRLMSILLLLQAHGKMSGRELAKRLEVSERTVHRDMEALSAARVPVFAVRGARGGWQLDENWRTRVPGLDEAELRALLMAQPRVIGDPRLAAAAESALEKLMAALPVPMRERAEAIRQRLYVDIAGWYGAPENLAALPTVQEAVARDRKLSFCYIREGHDAGARVVDPLGLVAKGASWYLVARSAAGIRTYRVSRIEKAKVLPAHCERPKDFDLAAHWQASTKEFQQSWTRYAATLRVTTAAAEKLRKWWTVKPLESANDGWETLRVHFEDEEQACFMVLGHGPRAEVIEPESLRERVNADRAEIAAHTAKAAQASL